jgi:hypothetical protein
MSAEADDHLRFEASDQSGMYEDAVRRVGNSFAYIVAGG